MVTAQETVTVQTISEGYLEQDPRKLPEGNWFVGTNSYVGGKFKAYSPVHVHFPESGLRLFFWYDREFAEWFKKYVTITGDFDAAQFELFEMYTQQKVNSLNEHKSDSNANNDLGTRIVSGGYTYKLGNRTFHFVQRFVNVRVEVSWSKGGI